MGSGTTLAVAIARQVTRVAPHREAKSTAAITKPGSHRHNDRAARSANELSEW